MHTVITTILLCGILSFLYIIYIKNKFTAERSKYHSRTIKLYLDYQFTAKILRRLHETDAYNTIIHDMKEYFLLDETAVFRLGDGLAASSNVSYDTANYIDNNMHNITSTLKHQEYVIFTIKAEGADKDIIIQYLDPERKLLILYAANTENKLSEDEAEMITKIVLPIINLSIKLLSKETGNTKKSKNISYLTV